MPNWVYITLNMKDVAKEDLFEEYESRVTKKMEKTLDFNKIIPEPTDIDEYLDAGYKPRDPGGCIQEDDDRPWFDWYHWHINEWGTKWNSCYGRIDDDDTIYFETAWGAPDPIFEKLSKMYPDRDIDISIDYEMCSDHWEGTYKDGKLVRDELTENAWEE